MWFATLIMIFLGGVFMDILHTAYIKSVARGSRWYSALLSGSITLAGCLLWSTVILKAENLGVYGLLSLASGSALGTALSFKRSNS